jgi:hypothetical protein
MPHSGVAVSRGERSQHDEPTAALAADREPMPRMPEGRRPATAARAAASRLPSPPVRAPGDRLPTGGVPGRRTVTIRGQGAERYVPSRSGSSRRRPPERRYERPGFRPDKTAMWAVLLGLMLILAAAASAHAATLHAVAALH